MIIDTSALVALAFAEAEAEEMQRALDAADVVGVGAPTLAETAIVLQAAIGDAAPRLVAGLVRHLEAEVIPFGDEHWRVAHAAFTRFGKGRHPARLNLGDCLSYAVARVAGRPLLCKGGDFPLTDLELVRHGAR